MGTERNDLELASLADPKRPPNLVDPRTGEFGAFPLAAPRLGPVWRALWRVLCLPGWHTQRELWDAVPGEREGHAVVKPITMINLLAQARRSGVVVCQLQRGAGVQGGSQRANAFRALGALADDLVETP